MEEQPDRIGKLALCVTSCMLAKENLVEEEGIGEDLAFTLFGWKDSNLIIVGQMEPDLMRMDHEKRLEKVYFCASMFRMGWGVDELTFMAEGYCSDNPEETVGLRLDNLFATGNTNVSECLTFTHANNDDVSLVVVPYKIELGRKVEWRPAAHQKQAQGLRDSAYPTLLLECLGLDIHEMPPNLDSYYDYLIAGIFTNGFSVDFLLS